MQIVCEGRDAVIYRGSEQEAADTFRVCRTPEGAMVFYKQSGYPHGFYDVYSNDPTTFVIIKHGDAVLYDSRTDMQSK